MGLRRGQVSIILMVLALPVGVARADQHTLGTPALSSKVGAAYTIYLDFSGFNFTGTWGGTYNNGGTPGNLLSYDNASSSGTFTTAEQANIKQIWARVAEKYAAFNINVTTVDPATTATTDAQRQAYYDTTARLMHTVVAGTDHSNAFIAGGGVSYLNVTANSYSATGQNSGAGAGLHTDFIYQQNLGGSGGLSYMGEAASHENGHGLTLQHQSDYSGTTIVNQYSENGGGNVNVAPIMGASYYSKRGVWRIGQSAVSSSTIQNDVASILSNSGMGSLASDNIGHLRTSATALTLGTGQNRAIDATVDKGIIVPVSSASPQAIGESSYTTDYYSFFTYGGAVNVSVNEGGELITPGSLDPGGTLDSVLRLLDANGNVIASATDPTTQISTISTTLGGGNYYLQIASAGGELSNTGDGAQYFDMGSYFLSGTVALPEPTIGGWLMLAVVGLRRKRRSN